MITLGEYIGDLCKQIRVANETNSSNVTATGNFYCACGNIPFNPDFVDVALLKSEVVLDCAGNFLKVIEHYEDS